MRIDSERVESMKFMYSKFTRAFSEVLLIILLVVLFFGTVVICEMYSNDIIDGDYEFRKTNIAKRVADNYYYDLSDNICMFYQSLYGDEIKENDTIEDVYIYDNGESTVYFDDGEIVLNALKDEELKQKVIENAKTDNVNYHFLVRTDDEILFTDISDMSEVEWVNTHSYLSYSDFDVYIENYINKNLEKGDEFYKYNFFYDKFVRNFWNIIIFMGITALLTLVLGINVIITAGCKEDGTPGTGWMDNIPIELYAIVFIGTTQIGFNGVWGLSYAGYIFTAVFLGFWFLVVISIVKTVISRLKNHVFLKTSILGYILILAVKMFKWAFADINTKVKAAVAIGGVMLCEVILVFGIGMSNGGSVFVWGLVKMAQFALLLCIYSMLLKLRNAAREMHEGGTDIKIDTRETYGIIRETADYMNDIFAGLDKAVAEKLKSEQLKTELITNVSHDIKTPLTSIINYVDLMKKEQIDNPKVAEYLEIVDKQSLRLKKLTEDVIEASKAATGNITAELANINVDEMIGQALGEYEGKFNEKHVMPVYENGDMVHYALADGRLLWRVIDNLFSNVCKYTMEGTRLYINIVENNENVIVTIKNISKYQLNISSEELMQRFVRGDSSRSTSGNGLGLSIAESLTKLQGGSLKLDINGDLFIVSIFLVKSTDWKKEQESAMDSVNAEEFLKDDNGTKSE